MENKKLKNDILSCYGICDLLASTSGLEFREDLNHELTVLYYISHDYNKDKTIAFIEDYLMVENPQAFFDHTTFKLSTKEFLEQGSILLEEFEQLDDEISFDSELAAHRNATMLYQVYERIIDGNEKASTFLKDREYEIEKYDESKKVKEQKADLKAALDELDHLIGLEEVKKEVHQLSALIQINKIRKIHGLKTPSISHHMVFVGNPGTGKTTVARLVGKIYKALGVLSNGHLVEADRSSLVAGYVGQTAIETKSMITKAKGGILFIDEAYALAKDSKNDFGKEAIETLLKAMEDQREDFVVIVAGYPNEMKKFLDSNPGFRSRFNKFIHFENYSTKELLEILEEMAASQDYEVKRDSLNYVKDRLETEHFEEEPTFGNGRFIRNLLEAAIGSQAERLEEEEDFDIDKLKNLIPADFKAAFEALKKAI